IGSDLAATPTTSGACFAGRPTCTFFQQALPGRQITSPTDGIVVRWRENLNGKSTVFRVLRPSGGAFVGAGTSAPGPAAVFGVQTMSVRLPIHAGDSIGVDQT